MTLATIGTTPEAQSANESIAATADANGNITFVGPSGLQGSTITTTATVPGAPIGAIFTATLGTPSGQGVDLQSWGGQSTAGRFQIGVGQTLVVTGAGLTPNTAYTCTFSMVLDVGGTQVVVPEPNSSALSAGLAGAGIAGVGLLGAVAVIAPGAGANILVLGTDVIFQIWNWGWSLPFSEVPPTAGEAELALNPIGPSDSLTFQEGASNRLAGAKGSPSATIVNFFNTQVEFFIVYSLV